jgi:LCP family protein required for cell wall assembly
VPSVIARERTTSRSGGLAFRWWWLIWAAAGICTFLCGTILGVVSSGSSTSGGGWFSQLLDAPFGNRDPVTILAVGCDDSSDRGLADTIIVMVVHPKTGEISALSIPRDSRVEVPGVGVRRINASHAAGGMPLTMQTVELLLGMPVDKYIEINVPGIVKLVDAVEGVDIDVEKRMKYHDRRGHLDIDLQPGMQHLDGTQAMGYVRFRHDATGDLGRMERQRHFLRAAVTQLMKPGNVTRLPQLAQAFVETVNTDLTVKDLLTLKKLVEQAGPDGVRAETLPGEPKMVRGQSMVELDGDKVRQTVDRVLRGQGLRVQVLNGTDINGFGARVASTLEEAGCDITEVANSDQKSDTTLVISRRGGSRRAERVAEWLGLGVISIQPEGDNPADVTVIVGRDLSARASQNP